MKRIAILAAVLLGIVSARGQEVITLDYSHYITSYGFVTPNLELGGYMQGNGYKSNPLCVGKPVKVYGIAVATNGILAENTLDPKEEGMTKIHARIHQQYGTCDSVALVDSIRLSVKEIADANNHYKILPEIRTHYQNDYFLSQFRILEFYFAEPIVVHDTIYTTVRCDSSDLSSQGFELVFGASTARYIPCAEIHDQNYWQFYGQQSGPWWTCGHSNWMMLPFYFPIITPAPEANPEECTAPQAGPRLVSLSELERNAVVEYETNNEVGDYQLAIAPWPADPDTLVPVFVARDTTALFTLRNLTRGQTYAVWQRDQCYYRYTARKPADSIIWSDWSEPLIFTLPARDTLWNTDTLWTSDTTYVVGGELIILDSNATLIVIDGQAYIILGTDTLDYSDPRLIWIDDNTAVLGGTLDIPTLSTNSSSLIIYPNPTTGDVTIDCGGLRVERIELLDLQGRVLLREEPDAASFKLQTSTLAPEAYLIRAYTPEGTLTRKIMKE